LTFPINRTYVRVGHDLDLRQDLIDAYGRDEGLVRIAEYESAYAAGDAEADRLAQLPVGPELAAGLVAAAQLVMSSAGRLKTYASWKRLEAWTVAQSQAALVDAAGKPRWDSDPSVIADAALLTAQSETSVGNQLAQARHMSALPQTWGALNRGDLLPTHAWALRQVTVNAGDDVAGQVEDRIVDPAIWFGWTPSEIRDRARKALIDIDAEGAKDRAEKAKKAHSDVRLAADNDDMAVLYANCDAVTGRQLMDVINRRADDLRSTGDQRTLGELRVAALADAVLGMPATTSDDAPRTKARTPKRATALLLLTLDTLLGGDGAAILDGYGPITAGLARQLAAGDVTFRRLVIDKQSGKPLDLGDRSYELSAAMRRWVETRDRTCRFRNCRRRAVFCDADHAVEWPIGQTTCANCGLLCRRHHNLKTGRTWRLHRNPDDSVDWLSPNGFRWRQPAATYAEFLTDPPPERD
jgi:hypothetical protein